MKYREIELELNWVSLAGVWLVNYLGLQGRERREALELLKRFGKEFFLFVYVFAEKLGLSYEGVRGTVNFFRFRYELVGEKVGDGLKGFTGVKVDREKNKIIVRLDGD